MLFLFYKLRRLVPSSLDNDWHAPVIPHPAPSSPNESYIFEKDVVSHFGNMCPTPFEIIEPGFEAGYYRLHA